MSLCDIQPVPVGVSDFILSGQTKESVTVPARFAVLSTHLFFGVALRMRDYAYYHFTWKHPWWLNAFPSHGFNHCYGLGSGKCHLKAYAVALCLHNITWKCMYSLQKLLSVKVWTRYCFLKTSHSWSVCEVLVWLRSALCRVYFETIVEQCKLKPSRVLSSQHYCFRATQDSWGVALPQLWLHNSHTPNGAPIFF